MSLDVRVGKASTGLLLETSLAYLRLNPSNLEYLVKADMLKWYQSGIELPNKAYSGR